MMVAVASAAAFAALFIWTAPVLGVLLAPVALLPVIFSATMHGLRGGLVAAISLGLLMLAFAAIIHAVDSPRTGLLRVGGLVAVGGVVGRLHDLRMQVRRESAGRLAALKESEDKSRFIATMSHELRTPLNAVLGFAQLLQRPEMDALTPRQQRYVENIVIGGQDLTRLVDEVLAFAKLSHAELDADLKPLFVGGVIEKVVGQASMAAEAKGLQLEARCEPEASAIADATLLERALSNLVGNAIKFTPRGNVRVTAVRSGDRVVIEVSDTGIGIAAADHERIFRPFQQLSGGAVREYGGVGLGLPITSGLVTSMHGHIEVASEPGRGSTFRLVLPAERRLPPPVLGRSNLHQRRGAGPADAVVAGVGGGTS